MKHIIFALALTVCSVAVFGQFATKLISYTPAPGQLINTQGAGSQAAAQSVVGGTNGLVSLGAFGGSVVYGFNPPIENHRDNPYGVDFTLIGNPSHLWAEPGIVQVMKDENNNGLPDDTWYELAGSDHFFSTTKKNYRIAYINPNDGDNRTIRWYDNANESGFIYGNTFHLQPYYPGTAMFPASNPDSLVFTGTCIRAIVDQSYPGSVLSYPRTFGYADNRMSIGRDYSLPDNPYTTEQEGCGGDPMDISWAIDSNGNYVNLDKIHFVRIYTSVNQNAGWLGEISTEIKGIATTVPNKNIAGKMYTMAVMDIPSKVITASTTPLEAHAFVNGRKLENQTFTFKVSDTTLAVIENNSQLSFLKPGAIVLTATWNEEPSETQIFSVTGIAPASIQVQCKNSVKVGDTLNLAALVKDNLGNLIQEMEIEWQVSNPNVMQLEQRNSQFNLKALNEGTCWLTVQLKAMPSITDSLQITVYEANNSKQIFLTLKDSEQTFYARIPILAEKSSLDAFVDRTTQRYPVQNYDTPTVAHALTGFFTNLGLGSEFKFRDDAMGNHSLYLWKVPFGSEANRWYLHGYGGATNYEAYAKAWLVYHNNRFETNNLDKIPLKNNDELILLHISNTIGQWETSILTSTHYQANTNDTIDFFLTRLTCTIKNHQVVVENATRISNVPVYINGSQSIGLDGNVLQTDDQGMASYRFTTPGEKRIQIGQDETVIFIENVSEKKTISRTPSGITFGHSNGQLNVSSTAPLRNVHLTDVSGKVLQRILCKGKNELTLSHSFLSKGYYFLVVETTTHVETHKFAVR